MTPAGDKKQRSKEEPYENKPSADCHTSLPDFFCPFTFFSLPQTAEPPSGPTVTPQPLEKLSWVLEPAPMINA
jgi:hypothetical protein